MSVLFQLGKSVPRAFAFRCWRHTLHLVLSMYGEVRACCFIAFSYMLGLVSWVECWVAITNCLGAVKNMFWVRLDVCACANNGGSWFFHPSECVSPRRDQQQLAQAACASYRSGGELLFWARAHLAQARRSRLSERAQ